jgi:serine/threonine protein kinase/cytochrome c-type biogenesis protein CcmH/NrfG
MQEDPTLPLADDTPSQVAQLERLAALDSGPRTASWGGFNLLARVGAGGFGEVYRAWDPSLQREVALKLLLPGALGSSSTGSLSDDHYEAVLREARALASVKHPNIVSIYGVDRHDDRVGFWTDFVRGRTLCAIVNDHGPFGYREAALMGIDVARALAAVHRAGLLHRDIKPENVMREEGGRILLMDFGLSTLPHRSTELSGTLNYMAPELFRGEPASVAADIYALGILLYFLVTGTHPVRLSGLSVSEAAKRCLQRTPLIDQRSDLPESFLRVVNTAIDPDPSRRYASAGALAEALAECIGISSDAQPVAPAVAKPADEPSKKPRNPVKTAITLILVFGFVFGDRIIHSIDSLFHPRPAAEPTTAAPPPPGDNSDLYLKAKTLLEQGYKPSNVNAALKISQQLTQSDPTYALGWEDLGYAEYLKYLLTAAFNDSKQAISLGDRSAVPYVTLARVSATEGKYPLAIDDADAAKKIDPTNSDAFRAEAAIYHAMHNQDQAVNALNQAIALNPDDWRGPMTIGSYDLEAGKLDDAATEFKKSASLVSDDDNRLAYYNLGIVDMRLNKLDEAQANISRAIQIEPDASAYQELAWLLIAQGKYGEAVEQDKKAVALQPGSYNAWANLGAATLQLTGGAQAASEPYRKAAELAEAQHKNEPKNAELTASLAYYYIRSGNRARGRTLIEQALALAQNDPKINYVAGEISEILGDRAKAIDLIAKSVGPGYSMAEISRDPDLKSLRADPAFLARLHTGQTPPLDSASRIK